METDKTDYTNTQSNENIISAAVIAVAFLLAAVFAAAGFFTKSDALIIGMFEDQRGFFDKKEVIEAAVGRPVTFRYYDSIETMKTGIASGELDIYVSPVFEFIASCSDAKAVATIESDYVLALRSRLGTPAQVGITEKYISTMLIKNSNRLDSKKISLLNIPKSSLVPYINEEIIECAVFRGEIPEELSDILTADVRLSELGFKHDLIIVRNSLLLKYDDLVSAIFSASTKISPRLPDEAEIKNAEFFLFQIGEIKKRSDYQHYVHIK